MAIELIAPANLGSDRLLGILGNNGYLKIVFPEEALEFVCHKGGSYIYNADNIWERKAPAEPARMNRALAVFSDSFGHTDQARVLQAYADYGEQNVWFLEHRGRYIPYRMPKESFVKLTKALKRNSRLKLIFLFLAALRRLPKWQFLGKARNRQLRDKLDALFCLKEETLQERFGRVFRDYFTGLNPNQQVRKGFYRPYLYNLFFIEEAQRCPLKGRILELGSGCGIQSLLFALLDRENLVVGLDIYYSSCAIITRFKRENLFPLMATSHILPLKGDSVDVIYASEAMQHFSRVDETLKECRRILKSGGALLIDEVNSESISVRMQNMPECPYRMAPRQMYEYERKKMISELLPSLGADKLEESARLTCGLEAEEIRDWVKRGLSGRDLSGIIAKKQEAGEFFPQRRLDGWCEERFFTAEDLSGRMQRLGFGQIRRVYHMSSLLEIPHVFRKFANRMVLAGIKN